MKLTESGPFGNKACDPEIGIGALGVVRWLRWMGDEVKDTEDSRRFGGNQLKATIT